MITIDTTQMDDKAEALSAALAMSLGLGRPVTLKGLDQGARPMALRRSHVMEICAVRHACKGRIDGAHVGSGSVTFRPGPQPTGAVELQLGGTANVFSPLHILLAGMASTSADVQLQVSGCTLVRGEGCVVTLQKSVIPILQAAGLVSELSVEAHGLRPTGGGRVNLRLGGCLNLTQMGFSGGTRPADLRVRLLIAQLPWRVAKTQLDRLQGAYGIACSPSDVEVLSACRSAGCAVILEARMGSHTEIFVVTGATNATPEQVVDEAVAEYREWRATGLAMSRQSARLLLVPAAICAQRAGASVGDELLHAASPPGAAEAVIAAFIRPGAGDVGLAKS